MAKDYSDYVLTIYSSGERIWHDVHYTMQELKKRNIRSVSVHRANFNRRFKYLFDGFQDRAYRTKLAPWKKVDSKRPFWTIKELFRSKKIGHLHYYEPSDPKALDEVEPMHISRIHQPSGRLEGQPREMVLEDGDEAPGLMEEITPFGLKTLVDNNFYMQAYKSFKFGFRAGLGSKWWVWAIIGIVAAIVVILYLTGNLGFGGR